MTSDYNHMVHTHVQLPRDHPLRCEGQPRPIVLRTRDRVWITAEVHELEHCDPHGERRIVQVGDGLTDSIDGWDGTVVLSLSAEGCRWCDEQEAAQIAECVRIDEQMLGWAR